MNKTKNLIILSLWNNDRFYLFYEKRLLSHFRKVFHLFNYGKIYMVKYISFLYTSKCLFLVPMAKSACMKNFRYIKGKTNLYFY